MTHELTDHLNVYLVGGAVRDIQLGREPKDRDYVVVGSSPDEMLALGYEQVGADFPVFLHPETREEYALARRERKTGAGYHGFDVEFGSSVTLEEDLVRRDLTINSMAMSSDGTLIDPYGGQADLNSKVLRATSAHFRDDPLRVVRLARFCARFEDFTVDAFTQKMSGDLVREGALNELPNERFWAELEKVFSDDGQPARFFYYLDVVGAFDGVRFFGSLFGPDSSQRVESNEMMLAAQAVKHVAVELRVPVFTVLVSPCEADYAVAGETKQITELRRAYALAVHSDGSAEDAELIVGMTRAQYALSASFTNLMVTLAVCEGLGVRTAFSKDQLIDCRANITGIRAEQFPGVSGRALGDALKAARTEACRQVLIAS